MKRLLFLVLASIVSLCAVIVVRTLLYRPEPRTAIERVDINVDKDQIAQRLSQAIQFKTISHQELQEMDFAPFEAFISWMRVTYPDVHEKLSLKKVSDYTLLFKWKGSDPDLKPILLSAHYDVVPAIPGTEEQWERDPFKGEIADGFIWGRGTLDDKSAVIAIMEASTNLLREGFQPKRTSYFCFAHNEEVLSRGGGAPAVVAHLKESGVQLAWSLDEGSFILDGIFPGLSQPVASINLAEKGYLNLELVAHGVGGHSSMPPLQTAVGILAKAIDNLQNSPFSGGLTGVSGELFNGIGPHLPFIPRSVFANRWLFGGILEKQLSALPATNAMLRTTIAPTMLSGSVKENVLPITATAVVNFRLHPRDTSESAIAHVRKAIGNSDIDVNIINSIEASPVSSAKADGFRHIANASQAIFGDIIIAPGLTVAATDSRHYVQVADDSYRFNPMLVGPQDITGFHGTNERISVENMFHATQFYAELLRRAQTPDRLATD